MMYNTKMFFVFACTFSLKLKFILGNIVVTSSYDGISHNATHPWSVGLPKLNITFSNFSSGVHHLKEFNSLGAQVFSCAISTNDGVCTTKDDACSCFNISSNLYEIMYTIQNLTKDNKNLTSIALQTIQSPPVRLAEATIFLTNCENLYAKTDGLSITGGINASYTDTATYNCTTKDSWIMTGETIMYFTHYYQLVCMVDTKWNGTTDVSCAYPPTNVSVTQSYFYENKSAQLICQHTPGHPKMNDEKFFIGKMNVTSNVTLLPEHYMKNYYCEIHNEYTDVSGKPARSDNGTLNVFFSPYDLYHTDDTQIAENETAEVYFAFRAHPNGSVVTNFTTPNGYILKELNYSDESPGSYNFTYSITVNSSDDYGKYIFIAKTIYPSGSVTGSINITKPVISTESTATNEIEGNEVDVPLIAGVCAGMFIVVLILVVLLILLRRRRERGISGDATGAKEEKDNPLYGTSVGAKTVVADKKGESLKEERENPLYASSAVSPVEEAYASVDTRKKKKNTSKGNDNNAFSTESAAVVYAAVNKPKKKKNDVPPVEAVYTEVNKKKR